MHQTRKSEYKFSTSLPAIISPEIKSGVQLAGNDFNGEQLDKWFREEKEAYFFGNDGNSDIDSWYAYMRLVNEILGFSQIINRKGTSQSILVLGPGSGIEIDKFASMHPNWSLFFLEASDNFMVELKRKYPWSQLIEPNINGNIELSSNSQDVVCAFSVLHHIPNVSHVLQEAFRVLKPGGLLLIREPCSSMGDWRAPRAATPNERGIASAWMISTTKSIGFKIKKKPIPIFFLPLSKILKKIHLDLLLPTLVFHLIDRIVSGILSVNVHYWRNAWYKKLSPSAYFYTFQKP